MSSKNKEKEQYIKMYPKAREWLNECVICHSMGFKPKMPEYIYPGRLAQNIRKLYPELNVNDISICDECARNWDK